MRIDDNIDYMSKTLKEMIVIERIPVPRPKKLRKFDLGKFMELSKKVRKILDKEAKEKDGDRNGFSYRF